MPKILLVKTSSMGDVIHNLPVVSDIQRHHSGADIDWVVEESFADIPALHPGVRKVIASATRRWRKTWFQRQTAREFRAFKTQLQSERYDFVVDTQGLLKSAIVTRMTRGRRYGYSSLSARESLSALAYEATFDVAKNMHAVERNRALAAAAMGYEVPSEIDYGMRAKELAADEHYAVLLHATSRTDKEWGEASWIALGQFLNARELEVLLPWGSEAERGRSEHLKQSLARAFVPSRMPLAKLAKLLSGATIVIGADTGLTHLAAALGRPAIGIYRGSDPRLTGLYGASKAVNIGELGRAPGADEAIAAAEQLLA